MSFVLLLSIGVALAACAAPVLLLRRPGGLVTDPIVRNAWIAYAVRLSVFVPLFAAGAGGHVWPALAGAAGFTAGIGLLGALRPSVAALRAEARRRGRPSTLHAVLAETGAGTPGLRVAAASVTCVALLGLAGAEAAAFVVVAGPFLPEGFGLPCFAALAVLAGFYGATMDPDGVRHVSQALLGAVFVGLFGAAAFLLYLNASDLRPMPPHGAFALIALPACCVAILAYRQTKYIEAPRLVPPDELSRWRRILGGLVRQIQRFANVAVSVLAVLVVLLAGLQIYALGLPALLRSAFAALGSSPGISIVGLAAIAMLGLVYPLVDAVSWRNADSLTESAGEAGTAPLRPFRMIAGETAILAVFIGALGAVAALASDLPAEAAGIADLLGHLAAFESGITDAALTLLLVGAAAMAAAAMGMTVSTAASVFRLDILAALPPRPGGGGSARRLAVTTAWAVAFAILAFWVVSGAPSAGMADARLYAPALAFACLQISLLPLLLARLGRIDLPGTAAALALPGGSAAAGLACIALHGATGDPLWLWLAVPATIGAGCLLLAAAAILGRPGSPHG